MDVSGLLMILVMGVRVFCVDVMVLIWDGVVIFILFLFDFMDFWVFLWGEFCIERCSGGVLIVMVFFILGFY